MLARLAENYLVAINSGHVPCLENAVLDLAKIENSAAVREAMSCYEECMNRQLVLPTNTVEELLQVQAECEREATKAFMARAFGSNIKLFQTELQVCFPSCAALVAHICSYGSWGWREGEGQL